MLQETFDITLAVWELFFISQLLMNIYVIYKMHKKKKKENDD